MFNNCKDAELGYAVTDHAAQGRTVHTGLAVITGTEDRQHAYVALSRGTEVNLAYVFTASPKTADPVPGPRPAPELARYDRRAAPGGPAAPAAPADPLAVLAGVLDRDGQQHSATQTRGQALADADHLAILHAIWAAETTPARDQAYRDLLMNTLPPGYRRQPGHQAKWLWRTLRGAELAGLDPGGVLAEAIAERDLAGSRDIAAVLDARIRHRLGTVVPLPPRPWSEQVPALADPEREAYVARDRRADGRPHGPDRRARRQPPPGLGHRRARPGPRPPAGPARVAETGCGDRRLAGTVRLRRSRRPDRPRASRGRPGRPGRLAPGPGRPRPGRRTGRARHARWRLLHLRDTYPIETAWAPRYVGDELRQVRAAAWDARLAALRAAAEARAAAQRGDDDRAAAQHKLAAGYQALERAYRQRETVFAQTMADRADWDTATRAQRQLAFAADAELRRRHPGQYFSPLRSAEPEPEPATGAQRDELTLTPDEPPGEIDQWITDLAAGHRTFAGQLADRQSQTVPSDDPGYGDLGPAFPAWTSPRREPILQPPMPEIPPSPRILERAIDRDTDWEAAD